MLHGHGDDWYRYKEPVKYNFSSNVWHEGPNKGLTEHMSKAISAVRRYPSPLAEELSEAAASFHGLPENYCLFTNGATEAFYLIAQLFGAQSATIFTPAFAEYEDACRIHGIETLFINLRQFPEARLNSSLVFICNPNNPDGSITSLGDLHRQISLNPESIFVLDEAYLDFSAGAASCVPLLQEHRNLIIVKSLTKLFCIPGIRLGYLLAAPEIILKLKNIKMPWSINSIAIAAGKYIFNHFEELKPSMDNVIKESKELQQKIGQIDGFSVIQADTTFFLLKSASGTAAELKDFLMHHYRILVRDATNFRGLEGEYIRIAVQSQEANLLLIKALKEWSRK